MIVVLLVKAEHFENNHRSEEISPDVLVMLGGMVLGPIVGKILFTRSLKDAELALAFTVSGLDFAVYDCLSHGIVRLEGCSRLLMAKFLENDFDVDSLACCDEEGCKLSFGGWGHDMFDDVCDVQ